MRTKGIFVFFTIILVLVFENTVLISNVVFGEVDENPVVVKVGCIDYNGFIKEKADGTYEGYGVDYLHRIALYTGWKYEYVCGSLSECIEMIKNKEIDILCCAQYIPERTEFFEYSKEPVGNEISVLSVLENDKNIYYEDFEKFNGMKVGVLKESYQIKAFEKYASENEFSYNPVYFKSDAEVADALDKGEIDGAIFGVLSSLSFKENIRAVAKFSVDPVYFITYKGNIEFMNKLNKAVEKVKIGKPYFEEELYKKYYVENNVTSKPVFTVSEGKYIENTKVVRVACRTDWVPFEYYDEDTQSFKGAFIDIINQISNISGIKFNFIPYNGTASQMLKSDYCDIIANSIIAKKNDDFILSEPYIKISLVFLSNEENLLKSTENMKFALPDSMINIESYIKDYFNTDNIVYYENVQTCLKKVDNGEADATLSDIYVINQLIKKNEYSNIIVDSNRKIEIPIGFCAEKSNNSMLLNVLNKSMLFIDEGLTMGILQKAYQDTGYSVYKNIWEKNYEIIILSSVLFLTIFIIIIYSIYKRQKMKVSYIANYDTVTNCRNMTYFKENAPKILKEYGEKDYYVVKFDILNFKNINQLCGIKTGDNLLKYIADGGVKILEDKELFAREYADNFIMLLKLNSWEEAEKRLCSTFDYVKKLVNSDLRIVFKIGVYKVEDVNESVNSMIDKAVRAQTSIKTNHSKNIEVYNIELAERISFEAKIESKMESALKNNEFKVFLQPKIDLKTLKPVGAEALVRWIENDGHKIYPDSFIPLFEKNGFIEKVDLYVLEQVCIFIQKRLNAGENPLIVSVNQSGVLFQNPNYMSLIKNILSRYDVNKYIELELTESIYFEHKNILTEIINEFHEMGLRISIDDFGSGYSSLNIISEINADVLKLDREFLIGSAESVAKKEIIKTIVQLAQILNMTVVCEGVETKEQEEFLQSINCDLAQGYFYARPMSVSEFDEYVNDKNK